MNDSSSDCVLLIEDDPEDAKLAIAALRENRIVNQVVHARDREGARDYLFGIGAHQGRDAILTSSDEEEDLVRGYRLGANSYVRKPIDYERFLEAIERLTVYWPLVNEAPSITQAE